MYQNSKLAKAVRLAMLVGATTTAAVSTSAFSEETESVERIEVTGSAIKRTDMEGALPVAVISQQDIVNTGVTSVPDLMAHIPSMQGFTAAGESVGGGGGGAQTASLRDLGSQYTLVLLNGRRMASYTSGGSVDLNSIPLSAIERVEVLTDGASALYGSDAIAGVINFILKKDVNETTFTGRFDKPIESGGESYNFSVSTGFGDIDEDGFNILLAYSRDNQEQLKSVDRDFAKTGFLEFDYNGERYVSINGSSNAIPGNAYLNYYTYNDDGSIKYAPKKDDDGNVIPGEFTDTPVYMTAAEVTAAGYTGSLNPYHQGNGNCHETSAISGSTCVFDYTSTLEIEPESTRDNVFLQGLFALGEDTELYSTVSYSKFAMTSRIAPYPTGTFLLPIDSALVNDNVKAYLSPEENADLARVRARWRTLPGGNRTNEYATDTLHVVAGLRGVAFDEVDYDFAITHADSTREDTRVTGYPIEDDLMALVTTGQVNVFEDPSALSDEQRTSVKNAMYNGLWDTTDTSLFAIEGKASMQAFELPAGDAYVAAGFDYREATYEVSISDANRSEIILFESAGDEFDLSRSTYGFFGELVAPLFEGFEVTTAVRYDNIGEITDDYRTGDKVVNESSDDVTYKLSFAYRPNEEWLLRGSFGTGFKAPSMREIADPRIEFGVTSVAYDCPVGLAANLAQYCHSDTLQYDVYREGYSKLKSETSEQMSVGFVYAPSQEFSIGMDYWSVKMEDQVRRLEQSQIFGDPVKYADLYTTKVDKGTGDNVLAIIQAPVNIGKSNNSGIDWDVSNLSDFWNGELRTSFKGTMMLESESLRPGEVGIYDHSLGEVGPNNSVTFRYIWNLTNTYTTGDWSFTANVNYRSGYDDIATTACLAADWADCGHPIQLDIESYVLTNVLANYNVNDNMSVSFGVKNLFDKQPPTTLNGEAGHQVGYDPRYTSAYGRTVYLTASYTL